MILVSKPSLDRDHNLIPENPFSISETALQKMMYKISSQFPLFVASNEKLSIIEFQSYNNKKRS